MRFGPRHERASAILAAALLTGCNAFPDEVVLPGSIGGGAGGDGLSPCVPTSQALTPVADAFLSASSPALNFADSTTLHVLAQNYFAPERALLRFDLSSLPDNAPIASAMLELALVYTEGQERQLTVHRVRGEWDEQSVSWQVAYEGYPWETVGGDYDRVFAALVSMPSSAAPGSIVTWDLTEEVRDLHAAEEENFGWLVRDWAPVEQRTLLEFGSREASARQSRPVLRVELDDCPD